MPFGSISLGLMGPFLLAFWVHSTWPFGSISISPSGQLLLAFGSVPSGSFLMLPLLFFADIMAISSIAVRIASCTDGIVIVIGRRNYRGLHRPFDGLDTDMITLCSTQKT